LVPNPNIWDVVETYPHKKLYDFLILIPRRVRLNGYIVLKIRNFL